jgi:hypothetical protein
MTRDWRQGNEFPEKRCVFTFTYGSNFSDAVDLTTNLTWS